MTTWKEDLNVDEPRFERNVRPEPKPKRPDSGLRQVLAGDLEGGTKAIAEERKAEYQGIKFTLLLSDELCDRMDKYIKSVSPRRRNLRGKVIREALEIFLTTRNC